MNDFLMKFTIAVILGLVMVKLNAIHGDIQRISDTVDEIKDTKMTVYP
jgi:hypothetical protein